MHQQSFQQYKYETNQKWQLQSKAFYLNYKQSTLFQAVSVLMKQTATKTFPMAYLKQTDFNNRFKFIT